MHFRIIAVAAFAAACGGRALAQDATPAAAPQPWSEQVQPGFDYRGDFLPDDPRITVFDKQVPAKCAILPSNDNDGFDVSIRPAPGNTTPMLITLSLQLQIGIGSCADFKPIRASAYDPAGFLGDNGRVRFYASGGDYVVRVLTDSREPERDPFILKVRKLDPSVRARKFAAGTTGSAAPAGPTARPVVAAGRDAVEQARGAYLQMCGKGAEKLSAATCAAMRRDLDAAVAKQAASAHEAEVMGVYRQLCTPGARKLSDETCASMLAEAKRTLAAGAAPPASLPPQPVAQAASPAPARARTAASKPAKAEVRSAYEELCAPGAQQVSAATCAAMKADAAN